MKIIKILGIILVGIVTSLFLFPIVTPITLGQNSKNLLAAVGLVFCVLDMSKAKNSKIDKKLLALLAFACVFSFVCLISVIYNNTFDYSYVSYPVSCVIWLCSAYAVVSLMRIVNGGISARVVANYVIAVCVFQCVIALLIDMVPTFGAMIDRYIPFGQEYYRRAHRLYGIGAALDPAGTKFAATLVIVSFMILSLTKKDKPYLMPLYIIAFCIITVLGNMIARTTTIGALLGLLVLFAFPFFNIARKSDSRKIWIWFLSSLAVIVALSSFFYSSNEAFRNNIRFGFEGFFSLVEKGYWETNSTNELEGMYVFPDNMKTWIIGDGYFSSALNDPHFVGDDKGVFYKNTDVGFCRFIFYCGLIGLLTFIAYFVYAAKLCSSRYDGLGWMFFLLFVLELLIWFKVATDIFLIFALFICASRTITGNPYPSLEEEYEDSV